jgi:hypothetical protein
LQLPTAPAVAAISMGALASEYLRFNRGRMWAPSLPRRRWMVLGLVACLGGAWALCLTDDWRLREAHGALKGGIVRIITTGGDLQSLKLVDSAHRSYPHDPRIVDYVGTAYTIYRGPDAVPIDEAVGRIEAAVAYDPWGPYLLGSLARKYLAIAGFAPPASRIPRQLALERATEIHRRLERVAYFSHETDTIGGTIALLRGDLCGARRLYRRALEKAPHDPTAQTGLSTAESLGRADQDSRSARCP